jgi:hypothetical protein
MLLSDSTRILKDLRNSLALLKDGHPRSCELRVRTPSYQWVELACFDGPREQRLVALAIEQLEEQIKHFEEIVALAD